MARTSSSLRPWNLRAGDTTIVTDHTHPKGVRRFRVEVTDRPSPGRNYFSGERVWYVPIRLMEQTSGPPTSLCYWPDELKFYSDDRVDIQRP